MPLTTEGYFSKLAASNEPLGKAETLKLLESGGSEEELVLGHIRLITKIALRFRNQGIDFGDLMQEGQMAFIRAVRLYDPEKGAFSTYIGKAISNAIISLLKKESRQSEILHDVKAREDDDAYLNDRKEHAVKSVRSSYMWSAINSLPPAHRMAILLSYGAMGGKPMKHSQIVSIFGPTGAMKNEAAAGRAISRAKEKVRDYVRESARALV